MKIRFTPDGLALLAIQGVVFVAAFSTGANLVYVVGSVITALFCLSMVHALIGFKGLSSHVELPEEANEGVPFPYRITLANESASTLHLLRVAPRFDQVPPGKTIPVFGIAPSERLNLKGEMSLPTRGSYAALGLAVQSVYPAGLLAREEILPGRSEVVVVPAPLKHPFPIIPGFNQRAVWTETGSNIKGEGTAFYGLKEYVPGDPISKIHWKATARHGKPLVIETEEDRVNRYYVFVDLRESKKTGEGRQCNLEVSIRIGATLTLQLLKLNCPVRVYLLDADLTSSPQSFTARDIPLAMRFLGRIGYTAEADFPRAVAKVLPEVPPGSFLLFVLPDIDPATLDIVRSLRHSPYSLFCLFNLPGAEAARQASRDPTVREIVKSGVYTVFFDGSEERVVSL